jgi:hypothetical protein
VTKSVKPNASPLPRDPQVVHNGVKNLLNHLVPGIRPAPAIHEQELVRVICKLCFELLADKRRHRNTVFGLAGLHRLNLPVPSRLPNVNDILIEIKADLP